MSLWNSFLLLLVFTTYFCVGNEVKTESKCISSANSYLQLKCGLEELISVERVDMGPATEECSVNMSDTTRCSNNTRTLTNFVTSNCDNIPICTLNILNGVIGICNLAPNSNVFVVIDYICKKVILSSSTSASDSTLMTSPEVVSQVTSNTKLPRGVITMATNRSSQITTTFTSTGNITVFPRPRVTNRSSIGTTMSITTDDLVSGEIPTDYDIRTDISSTVTTKPVTTANDSGTYVVIVTLSVIIGVLVIVVITTIICLWIFRKSKIKSRHHTEIQQHISEIRLSGIDNTYRRVPLALVNPTAESHLESSEGMYWEVNLSDEDQGRPDSSACDKDKLEEPEKMRTDKDGDSGYTEVNIEDGLPVADTIRGCEGKESKNLSFFKGKDIDNGYTEINMNVRSPVTVIYMNSNDKPKHTDKDDGLCKQVPSSPVTVIKGKDNYNHIALLQNEITTEVLTDSTKEDGQRRSNYSADPVLLAAEGHSQSLVPKCCNDNENALHSEPIEDNDNDNETCEPHVNETSPDYFTLESMQVADDRHRDLVTDDMIAGQNISFDQKLQNQYHTEPHESEVITDAVTESTKEESKTENSHSADPSILAVESQGQSLVQKCCSDNEDALPGEPVEDNDNENRKSTRL